MFKKMITFISILFIVIGLPTFLRAQGDGVVPTGDDTFITDLIAAVTAQTGLGGWAILIGILGTLCMFSVRAIKVFLPSWWSKLSPLARFALPFLAASIGSAVVGIAGAVAAKIALGTVVAKLVSAAIAAGFAAVTLNEGSKQVGLTFDMMMLKNNPDYIPGSLRKKMSLVVGIPDVDGLKDKLTEVK